MSWETERLSMTWVPTLENCDNYMDEREGKYEYRAIRYRKAIDTMVDMGLRDGMTVMDIGAGMTEFAYCLMAEYHLRVRYIPVDGGIDGTDLNESFWKPPRSAHFIVGLEILEHLVGWRNVLDQMKAHATIGVVVTTPDPRSTDVIGMDPTHVVELSVETLREQGMEVESFLAYGGTFNKPGAEGANDSLMGVWKR